MAKFDLGKLRTETDTTVTKFSTGKKKAIEKAKEAAAGLPSPYVSELSEKLRQRTQLSFGKVPDFVCEMIEEIRNENPENKLSKIGALYHILRKYGKEIPEDKMMDRRNH